MTLLIYLGSFLVVGLAARQIGGYLTRFNLPLISGYLVAGIIIGPFVLNIIPHEGVESLRFISDVSLAYIAFAAGSELYLKEIRGRLKSIAWYSATLFIAPYILGIIATLLLINSIPFPEELQTQGRIAVALLAASILVALSPSSTIAIVNELRARGAFTKTVLGVTVVLDVGVIALFAFSSSIADVFLSDTMLDLGFVLLLIFEFALALGIGYLIGRLLQLILTLRLSSYVKMGLILLVGYGVFWGSAEIRELTHQSLPFEVFIEPLLVCMIGSFWLNNWSDYRDEFVHLIEEMGPAIYVLFFTLVGGSLSLDILATVWPIALILVLVRAVGIFVGSYVGGVITGDPPQHRRYAWLAYITQAGIGLGLAQEIAVEFPELGTGLPTVLISAIVISQLIGPPFLKFAIRRVGEAHTPADHHPDTQRDAVIAGIDGQAVALAQRLETHNWQVRLIDIDETHVKYCREERNFDAWHVSAITKEALAEVLNDATDALIAMFDDDMLNLEICQVAYEDFGIRRLIVRLNDFNRDLQQQFTSIGATVVYPATTMVNLLDQLTRAPQSAQLLLQSQPDEEIVQITVTDEDVDGKPLRDLRLPSEVLVLSITRDGQHIVPRGYTVLRIGDEITLIGDPECLRNVTARLGY